MVIKQNFQRRQGGSCNTILRHISLVRTLTSNLPKIHFAILDFIVSVARGPEVSRVRSITELCGLRVSVESYLAPKRPMQCKR